MLNLQIILDSVKDVKDITLLLQTKEAGIFSSTNVMMDREGGVQPWMIN